MNVKRPVIGDNVVVGVDLNLSFDGQTPMELVGEWSVGVDLSVYVLAIGNVVSTSSDMPVRVIGTPHAIGLWALTAGFNVDIIMTTIAELNAWCNQDEWVYAVHQEPPLESEFDPVMFLDAYEDIERPAYVLSFSDPDGNAKRRLIDYDGFNATGVNVRYRRSSDEDWGSICRARPVWHH